MIGAPDHAIRILIIARHAAVRVGLHSLLGQAVGIDVVGEVGVDADIEHLLAVSALDVVVLDDPPLDRDLRLAMIEFDTAVVLLTDSPGAWERLADQDLHGWALLRREAEGEEITSAVRAAANGLIVLDRSLSYWISPHDSVGGEIRATGVGLDGGRLSAREREVLQLMTLGLPNKQIAGRLRISLSTVKFHVASILAKMGASSRTEAVTLGIRRGDVSL